MASWFERGRPALQEALNAVCDSIDADLRAELRAAEYVRKKHESEELVSLRKRVENVQRLEEENRQLQATVLQLQRKTPPTPAAAAEAPPPDPNTSSKDGKEKYTLEQLKTTTEDTRETLAKKNYILVRKFQALDGNYKKVMPMYTANKKKVAERDATIASLKTECEGLKRRLAAEDDEQDNDGLPPLGRPRASSHEPSSSLGNDPADGLSFSSDPGPDVAGDESGLAPPAPARKERQRAVVPPSEATTVGSDPPEPELPPLARAASEQAVIIKDEPSSEEPVIVSERRVRKRKAADDADEDHTPKRPVKTEDKDSSPPRVTAVLDQDSLDLDEVPRFNTPRKLRLWADEPTSGPSTVRRVAETEGSRARVTTPSTNATRSANESTVLTPVDANIRTRKPQTVAGKPSSRSSGSGIASGIRSLAEDGGNLYQRAVRRKTGTHLQETPGETRLSRLLESPGRTEEPAILRSAPPLRLGESSLGLPPRRELPFDKSGRPRSTEQTPSRAAKTTTTERGVLTGGFKPRSETAALSRQNRKEQQPAPARGKLREKDISELLPEDFKINPKTNAGADFAYNEVVRGRAERACLSGCTDMSCCGAAFRGLARLEMNKRTAAEDAKLFEEYLGDGVSRVHGLSKAEKDELWLEARTWQLAKTQGKHRHRHARRASPPGFWDTGFPSTQEVEKEKEEAARRERAVVKERHREAMRSGGLWLFRDE